MCGTKLILVPHIGYDSRVKIIDNKRPGASTVCSQK